MSPEASRTNRPDDEADDDAGELRARAEQGDADAQYRLGVMYSDGRGVTQDEDEATAWYRKAAAQGNADAQFCLGAKYQYGLGFPKDDVQAVAWYGRAAEREDPDALHALGLMYAFGHGVPQDFVEAYTWITLGVERACGPDKRLRAQIRTLVAQCMTRRQLNEARKLARLWAEAFERREALRPRPE